MWLWGLGGATLGLMTGIVGRTGVFVCTEAVERTVHHHLTDQLAWLKGQDTELENVIADIQAQEVGHLEWAAKRRPGNTVFGTLLDRGVTGTVEALIWLSTQGESARLSRDLRAKKN